MATMQELYQQYLLTQPGIGVSQNRYRELMSQARPFVNPYPAGTGLLAGGTVPRVPAKTNPMGTYTGESSGGGGTGGGGGGGTGGGGGGGGGGGTGGPNVSFDENGNIVGNNVNSNVVGGAGGLLGLAIGLPGLGFIARELANRYNFTNDQAAMFANVGLRDTTDPANLTGLIGRTATIGPTGTGGQAQRAGAAAAEDARAMGFTDAAIAAAAQAAANATIDGKTAEEATAAARSAAFAVAQNINDYFAVNENITSGLIGSRSFADPRAFQSAQQAFTQGQIDAAAQAQAQQAAAQAQAEQDTAAVNVSSPTAVSMTSMQDALNRDAAAAVAAREADRDRAIPSLLDQFAAQIEAQQAAQQAADNAAQNAASMQSMQDALNSDTDALNSFTANERAMQSMQDALQADVDAANSLSGGGYNSSDYGGYSGSETQSSGEAFSNFKGGLVNQVFGPNPKGPDDGAGLLQIGEFVIKKSAVKKYGEGLLSMINDGKIPAKK